MGLLVSMYASARQGNTSVGDFLAATDIGKRPVTRDGKACAEYFAFKDGRPVKMVCPPG